MFTTRGIPRQVTHCGELPASSERLGSLSSSPRALLGCSCPWDAGSWSSSALTPRCGLPPPSPTSTFLQNWLILGILQILLKPVSVGAKMVMSLGRVTVAFKGQRR